MVIFKNNLSRKIRYLKNLHSDKNDAKLLTQSITDQPQNRRSAGAVVLHLYYEEMWPEFSRHLHYLLTKKKLDIFISLNAKNQSYKDIILHDYPFAHVLVLPNRGRDVLAFLAIGRLLRDAGYEYFLKIHSKKSPQRKDGNQWADQIFRDLIVEDDILYGKLEKVLTDKNTGIVGPSECYVPLPTYYNDNHVYIMNLLTQIKDRQTAEKIGQDKWEYGFFAGTMFWARVDALSEVFDRTIKVREFEKEGAQLDGTIAHAFERIFSIIPEINNKKIYELNSGHLSKISYKTAFTPEWSDHYQG